MNNKNNSKKSTIYDIAKKAGTSTATVSRVLSNSGYPVKQELKDKITAIAEQMNYTPNMAGRMLKTNESSDIGVIIPTISNPFYTQVVLGIELEARKNGYGILLCNSLRDKATQEKYIETLKQKQVKGIIISSVDRSEKFIKSLKGSGISIVVIDQKIEGLRYSKVSFDYEKGGVMATEHLIGKGHRKIAFLTSPLTRESRTEILEGYKKALGRAGISLIESNVIISEYEEETELGTYEFENGKRLAEKFLELKDRPTAILAINDMTALGIIQSLLEHGVRVPEDVSVMGFDNIEVSSMINPPLTTINQPSFETGRQACRLLLDNMKDIGGFVSITLEPELVARKSVAQI